MEFRLIDYSKAYYGKVIPSVRSGKFIQIVDPDENLESILLSPYELSKFHAQILERYCVLNEIEGRFIKMPEFYQVTGADIKIVGGGHWEIGGTFFKLSGRSTIYGKFNPEGLAGRIRDIPEYRSVTLIVE